MRPDAPATATRQGVEEDAAAAVVFTDMSILQKKGVSQEISVRLARMALPRARRKNLPRHHGQGMRPATQREDDSRGG